MWGKKQRPQKIDVGSFYPKRSWKRPKFFGMLWFFSHNGPWFFCRKRGLTSKKNFQKIDVKVRLQDWWNSLDRPTMGDWECLRIALPFPWWSLGTITFGWVNSSSGILVADFFLWALCFWKQSWAFRQKQQRDSSNSSIRSFFAPKNRWLHQKRHPESYPDSMPEIDSP